VARVAFIVGAPLLLASVVGVVAFVLPTAKPPAPAQSPPPMIMPGAVSTQPRDFRSPIDREDEEIAEEQRAALAAPQLARRQAVKTPRLSAEGEQAYAVLLIQERFEGRAIGYAGFTSQAVTALRTLLVEKNAAAAFRSLLTRATLAGQLYALCGLYFADPKQLLIEVQPYRSLKVPVLTLFGCLGGGRSAEKIVEHIVDGTLPNGLRQTH
jgi:hypothetical protein